MNKATLEVLLVNAEGIRHTNIIGRPAYYVTIECGSTLHKSKISSDEQEHPCWNEKFRFEFPLTGWEHLIHMKFKIMDTEIFKNEGFVGETIINIKRIVEEGLSRGIMEVEPAPYNVVLDDDTYKGEIKIGFKFTTNEQVGMRRRDIQEEQVNATAQPIVKSLVGLWRSWWRICCLL